jgi:hypothetical protein
LPDGATVLHRDNDDYNLGVACRQSFVNYKTIGLVANAIAAYQRHLDREAELNIRRCQNLERMPSNRASTGENYLKTAEIGRNRQFPL